MHHQIAGRRLGRTSSHRKALFRNLVTNLFEYERITTTVPKAKELRGVAEKLITIAREDNLANRRRVRETVQKKEVFQKLFTDIAPRFISRPGGYTRIYRAGNRPGDNAEMAIIELVVSNVTAPAKPVEGAKKKPAKVAKSKEKKTAPKKEATVKAAANKKEKAAAKAKTAKATKSVTSKPRKTQTTKAPTAPKG